MQVNFFSIVGTSLFNSVDLKYYLAVAVFKGIHVSSFLDPSSDSADAGIDNLADAVTHARFVGTDPSSDEVVLMKILQVRRSSTSLYLV